MRKEKMRWLYVEMLGTLILSLALAASVLSAPPKAPVVPFKIAFITSLSGPGFGYGQRSLIGFKYKIEEEINKTGGVNGYPVEIITYDTATRPDQAAMLTDRAATVDKVFVVVGPNASSEVAVTFPTASRLSIPNISLGGTIRGLCEKNVPWCFSPQMSADFSMEPLALLIDRYKAKNIVLMVDAKYSYAVSQGEDGYKIAERKGVKVLHDKGKLDVETGWADFTPQVTKIKDLRPDLICAILFPPDVAHLAIALKGAGIDAKVVPCFGSLMVQPDMIKAGGEAAEGWYGSGDFDVASTDRVQVTWQKKLSVFAKTVTSDSGLYEVQTNTANGYDAAAFLCEAIRRTKITPNTPLQEARTKIRDELPKIKMKTYSSTEFRFGEGGRYEKNRLVKPIFLLQVKGGKLVTVGQLTE